MREAIARRLLALLLTCWSGFALAQVDLQAPPHGVAPDSPPGIAESDTPAAAIESAEAAGVDGGDLPDAAGASSARGGASIDDTDAAVRVGLVTMQPGIEYWARFGHNAILIDDGESRTLYNYGYFDFAQPRFLTRFLQGRMLYRLVALPIERDLQGYAEDGRGVRLQWLDIPPARSRELAQFLAWNAQPENAEYRYDYFVDNCSTRVRDALDRALDGALEKQLRVRSHGFTYRSEAQRLAATLPWLYLGIHLGLGPFTDTPLSLWEESFIPMRLRDAVAESRNAQGAPLVLGEVQLLEAALDGPPASPPQWRWRFASVGVLSALALSFLLHRRAPRRLRRLGAASVAMLWSVSGLIGIGLSALWAFTDHAAAWGNENALLFNPLCLVLLAGVPALARGREASRLVGALGLGVALLAGLALFLKFLPFRIQSNGDWIALMLPIHAALALRLSRRSEATGNVPDADRSA